METSSLIDRLRDIAGASDVRITKPLLLEAAAALQRQADQLVGLRTGVEMARMVNKLLTERAEAAEKELAEVRNVLSELRSLVIGECPSLLNEDSGGDARLAIAIDAALSKGKP